MTAQDDPGRARERDPFDFREPPGPLAGTPPPTPGPSRSPFTFPAAGAGGARRGRLGRLVPSLVASSRSAAPPPSASWIVLAIVLLAVLILIAALVAVS